MKDRCQESQNCRANTEQLYIPRSGAMLINGFNFNNKWKNWFGKKLKFCYEKTVINVMSV